MFPDEARARVLVRPLQQRLAEPRHPLRGAGWADEGLRRVVPVVDDAPGAVEKARRAPAPLAAVGEKALREPRNDK